MPFRNPSFGARLFLILVVATVARLPGLFDRSIWYDEAITLLILGGNPHPAWPREPTSAGEVQEVFMGRPTAAEVRGGLDRVNPPLYYWGLRLWRSAIGHSLEAARSFSLLWSLATVVVLARLLQAARVQYGLILTLAAALSAAANYGQEARSYAMATCLVMLTALCAYETFRLAPLRPCRAAGYAFGMAVCGAAAFYTHYLTLWPVTAIVLWYLFYSRKRGPGWFLVPPLSVLGLSLVDFVTVWGNRGAMPGKGMGFEGLHTMLRFGAAQIRTIWNPTLFHDKGLMVAGGIGISILVVFSGVRLIRDRRTIPRPFWMLLVAIGFASVPGLFLVNVILEKHTAEPRYLIFGGPAFTVVAVYGITRWLEERRRAGVAVLVLFFAAQMLGVGWGGAHKRNDVRRLADRIVEASSPSSVVAIGTGYGRGDPGAMVYELPPTTRVVMVGQGDEAESFLPGLRKFEDIWIVSAMDWVTRAQERALARALLETEEYERVGTIRVWSDDERVVHLRRRGG